MLGLSLAVTIAVLVTLLGESGKRSILFVLGIGMGVTLLYASFGFSGAYRKLLVERDMTGVVAQLFMLGVAIVLFAPVLSQGSIFNHGVSGSLAPVSVSVAVGAFIFGIGMQFARGCASGTLYTVGGGNPRMALALLFFCVGAFWGSLDLGWWQTLPSLGVVSLGSKWGWGSSVVVQLSVLGLIFLALRRGGWTIQSNGFKRLLLAAGALALFNWGTLLVTGHGWSITWAFSLWAAKGAVLLGWDPMSSSFWASGFQAAALKNSVLMDETSVMNIGILMGALVAATVLGSWTRNTPKNLNPILAAVLGGLALGYGARLSYGCNIGAFFSGVASGSLHGWLWIICALPGNGVGVFARKWLLR